MPHSSAVVVLIRVHVARPRYTRQLFAVALSPAEGTSICGADLRILLLLQAARGKPGLLVPPARLKRKATRTIVPLVNPPALLLFAIQA